MIFEDARDTEDWSNGFWKFSFAIIGSNYILIYIYIYIIDNSYVVRILNITDITTLLLN